MTTLQVTRPKEWQNKLRKYQIYIDNEKAGDIANGETKDFLIPPGQHTIVAKIDWCSSPEFIHNFGDDEIQYLKVGSNKLLQWMSILVLPILLLRLLFKNEINADYVLFLLVPFLLFFIYMFTFGRKKYLNLQSF